MIKKSVLFFLCFMLFLSMPGCKKKLPTQPDIPTVVLPTIAYFNANPASIKLDDFSTLSWSTTNATNITINHGVGTVSATGTADVSPEVTTSYTLTATNSDGTRTASCTVEILQWAELDFCTIPEYTRWTWDGEYCFGTFTVQLTETAGVSGKITLFVFTAWTDLEELLSTQVYGGGSFNPYGQISWDIVTSIDGRPDIMLFNIEGIDNNGYAIELIYYFNIYWTQSTGTMRFLKIVEGASHHKLIK